MRNPITPPVEVGRICYRRVRERAKGYSPTQSKEVLRFGAEAQNLKLEFNGLEVIRIKKSIKKSPNDLAGVDFYEMRSWDRFNCFLDVGMTILPASFAERWSVSSYQTSGYAWWMY